MNTLGNNIRKLRNTLNFNYEITKHVTNNIRKIKRLRFTYQYNKRHISILELLP